MGKMIAMPAPVVDEPELTGTTLGRIGEFWAVPHLDRNGKSVVAKLAAEITQMAMESSNINRGLPIPSLVHAALQIVLEQTAQKIQYAREDGIPAQCARVQQLGFSARAIKNGDRGDNLLQFRAVR